MDDLYVKSLEDENERLRESLSLVRLELDEIKEKEKKNLFTATTNNVMSSITIGSPKIISSNDCYISSQCDSEFYICGIKLTKKDIEYLVTSREIITEELAKANLWKTILILWRLLVIKKSLKKE